MVRNQNVLTHDKPWSSTFLTVALLATLAFVATLACEGKDEKVGPSPAADPVPSVQSAEPSKPPAQATDPDRAYDPMVLTDTAVDIETRLAFLCRLSGSKVFFKFDSAKLLPGAKERLEQIATCAKTGPAKGLELLVVGRTDPVGSDAYNDQLGMSRADAVARYLRELGVDRARVETESKGEDDADEAVPSDWPTDRRVTVRLQSPASLRTPETKEEVTDQQIATAVAHTLLTDAALLDKQISAEVDHGIVTLRGTADHLLAKERAAKLTRTVRGVLGVVNTIALETTARSDDHIRSDISAALRFDAATSSYTLEPTVVDGVVTLRGTVQSFGQKRLAVHVAKGVRGVKDVIDEISLESKINRPDTEIAAEVQRSIAINVWLSPNLITTVVKDGAVTLTGAVGSSAQQDLAALVAWTAGVKAVNTEGLQIVPWTKPSGQRDEMIAIKGDPQIKRAVQDAFVLDPRVFSLNPGVEVENGEVTLTGVVDNLKARRSAEQDAKNTVGVWQVKNLLTIRPATPIGDDELAKNVDAALRRDPVTENRAITVDAKDGDVTLTGSVFSRLETAQAEDIASRANGVVNVTDKLTVSYPTLLYYDVGYDPHWAIYTPYYAYRNANPQPTSWPRTGDAKVKKDVEAELFWSPFVDADRIVVTVDRGVVALNGTVGSWSEVRAATDNAYEGGALAVTNSLTFH